jgi:nitrite reductase/ring-hydroxylating ferredoxin subunit
MARYIVGKASEFSPGSRKIVTVAGRSIGVFYINGEFFAVRNRCPHAGAPLCQGDVGGVVRSSEPGQFEYSRSGEFIRCPWHSWEFDLRTGRTVIDPARIRVQSFEAKVVRGGEAADAAVIELDRNSPPPPVETYPVSVDEDYVQIEV